MPNLYQSLVGDDWETLDPSVRSFLSAMPSNATALFAVSNGNWRPAQFFARMLGLPRAGKGVHVHVRRYMKGTLEVWERTFPDVKLVSRQWQEDGLLAEHMGIVVCRFRLRVVDGALMFQHHSTLFAVMGLRIHIPKAIAPTIHAYCEPATEPQSTFTQVSIWLPLVRIVLTYAGIVTQR